jgi:polyferredoxin
MITNAERRFIEQWRDQKSGPKWKYYLLFSMAWSVVSFLVIFFLLKLFTNLWQTGGQNLIYLLLGIAIIIGFSSTHFTYVINEKKYHAIMEREKKNKR